jgi:hypothetical protein
LPFLIYYYRKSTRSHIYVKTRAQRNKVTRKLDDVETAQTHDGWPQNLLQLHETSQGIDGKTPAQKAKIADNLTPENWLSLIKKASQHQSFEAGSFAQ